MNAVLEMPGVAEQLSVPGVTDLTTLICISRARSYKQYCDAVADALEGRCPFCQFDPDRNKLIFEDDFFRSWYSTSPEDFTKLHTMLAPKRHVTDSTDLTDTEERSFLAMKRRLKEKFGYSSRGELVRDGDARLGAGSIQHLHFHIMVPDGTGRVESPFYKGVDADKKSLLSAIVLEKIRLAHGDASGLSAEERERVKDRKVPGLS